MDDKNYHTIGDCSLCNQLAIEWCAVCNRMICWDCRDYEEIGEQPLCPLCLANIEEGAAGEKE